MSGFFNIKAFTDFNDLRPYQKRAVELLSAHRKIMFEELSGKTILPSFMLADSNPNQEIDFHREFYGLNTIKTRVYDALDEAIQYRLGLAFNSMFPPETIESMIANMRYESAGRIREAEPGYPFTWQFLKDKTVLLLSTINFTLPIWRKADLKCSTAFGWTIVAFQHGAIK